MTTLAVPAPVRTEVVQWLAPAPLWDSLPMGSSAAGLTQPWITELTEDTFATDFTSMLAGENGTSPADLAAMAPRTTVGDAPGAPYRLFQPLSQRYYFVAAELVCRRPGIPDHAVQPKLKERTTFVMRRLSATGEEEGFVPGTGKSGTWLPAPPTALLDGEKEHPMHPAPIAPYAPAGAKTAALGLDAATGPGRTLFYGYVPVAMGETMRRPMADPAQAFADLVAKPAPPGGWPDPILSWLQARVLDPWAGHVQRPPANVFYPSLYLLLDLGDWLNQHLHPVFLAIKDGGNLPGAYGDLLTALEGQNVTTYKPNATITLRQAIRDTIKFHELLTGADIQGPGTDYDLFAGRQAYTDAWLPNQVPPLSPPDPQDPQPAPDPNAVIAPIALGTLGAKAKAALAVNPVAAKVPPELEDMIMERPAPPPGSPDGAGTAYVIRAVFGKAPGEREPCTVLSEPSHRFELARAMDPDAPARKILLQMPDIAHMRQFKRGVAIELPPNLQRMLDRVTPDVLKGDPVGPDNGLTLGWICSFSLQIIFLVAFVVMFIFLLLLNICFFWMPFLKICFPIPVPASSSKGPTP